MDILRPFDLRSTSKFPILFLTFLLTAVTGRAIANFEHPRGLIGMNEVKTIRTHLSKTPYREILSNLRRTAVRDEKQMDDMPIYDQSYLASVQAFLFLLTEEVEWAEKAYQTVRKVIQDTVYFTNPISRGLTRAALLQRAAMTYDFAYHGWSEIQRDEVNNALYDAIYSVNANMGFQANYNIESNWMGVRYGSVILASLIWDDKDPDGSRTKVKPLLWDATKRLKDHLEKNIYQDGWNSESLGYHTYNWSFIGPALVALNRVHSNSENFHLKNYAPNALRSMWGISTSTVSIKSLESRGMHADLSDDNLMASIQWLLALGIKIYPDEQQGAIKWMHDYLGSDNPDYRGYSMYSLLYYPADAGTVNPQNVGWLNFHDKEQGIVIFRNQFKDESDIVATYTATAKRVRGHQGPDTNTFRLIGLGVPWIVGGGRTGEIAGQTNLFPAHSETGKKGNRELGKLLDYQYRDDGSGFAFGAGSCMGVEDHKRYFMADYSGGTGAEAVIIVSDSSQNGRRWRLNTPEFNQINVLKDGFLIEAPNGSTLKGKVFTSQNTIKIDTGRVRYGGSTVRNNPGIRYQGKSYTHTRYLDINCEGNIIVVMTLQIKDKTHPKVAFDEVGHEVIAGGRRFRVWRGLEE